MQLTTNSGGTTYDWKVEHERESIGRRLASKARLWYYVARDLAYTGIPVGTAYSIRVYAIVSGQLVGLDHLMNQEERAELGLEHIGRSGMGFRLERTNRRYQTNYAAAVAIGRILGLKGEPTSL